MTEQEVLKKALDYDPVTGALTWKRREVTKRADKAFNSSFAGKPAMACPNSSGYLHGRLFGKDYRAHRVIWIMMTGEQPNVIDHINGDPADNRWENIRSVSHSENMKNLSLARNSTSGVVGVRWHRSASKWAAEIKVNRKTQYLGVFSDINDAIAARKNAEIAHGFSENHGRSKEAQHND